MTSLLHTGSGRAVNPLQPCAAVVCLADIARSLSRLARYLGHTRQFYSVAQHSVIVSNLVEPEHALKGLLHDASEAYLGDVVSPLRRTAAMGAYRAVEGQWLPIIFGAFGLTPDLPDHVQAIDVQIRINEGRDLFDVVPAWAREGEPLQLRGRPIVPITCERAEVAFLNRFHELTRER